MTEFPTISELYTKIPKRIGEVGIEIEMEGQGISFPCGKYWIKHSDGSLRGEAIEYVLSSPVLRDDVTKALSYLDMMFRKNGSILTPSDRCGVHVHLNVQSMTFQEVFNFILLYLVLEDVLLHYCGDSREGNLFCLRASDATALVDALMKIRRNSTFDSISENAYRYAAINIYAVLKYGSLEFRSLGTSKNILSIQDWVNLLLKIKDHSKAFKEPHDIVEGFSKDGGLHFLSTIMEEHTPKLMFPRTQELLMSGVRLVQDIAYTRVVHKPITKEQLEKKKQGDNRKLWNNIPPGYDAIGPQDIVRAANMVGQQQQQYINLQQFNEMILQRGWEEVAGEPVQMRVQPGQPPVAPQVNVDMVAPRDGKYMPSRERAEVRRNILGTAQVMTPIEFYIFRIDDNLSRWISGVRFRDVVTNAEFLRMKSLVSMCQDNNVDATISQEIDENGNITAIYSINFNADFPPDFPEVIDIQWDLNEEIGRERGLF